MYYKGKFADISTTKQSEDRFTRFDYQKTTVELVVGIRGGNLGIRDNLFDSK